MSQMWVGGVVPNFLKQCFFMAYLIFISGKSLFEFQISIFESQIYGVGGWIYKFVTLSQIKAFFPRGFPWVRLQLFRIVEQLAEPACLWELENTLRSVYGAIIYLRDFDAS